MEAELRIVDTLAASDHLSEANMASYPEELISLVNESRYVRMVLDPSTITSHAFHSPPTWCIW